MLVGGDFFDLFPMDGGNWKAVIGDVSGKGADAAALMGFVRFTIRAVSKEDTKPSDALRKVNAALREEIGEETTFCTAVITRIHPNDEGARLTIAVAGHPLPFAIRSDGLVETVGTPGALLGFLDEVEINDTAVDLRPGDAFLLLTDGVLESSRDPRWAEEDLPRLLSVATGMRPITVVDLIEGSVAAIENRRSDDIALLAMQLSVPVDSSVPVDPTATRALVIDETFRIVDANTPVLADLGYARGEITGLDVRDLVVDPDDVERETRPLVAEGSWAGEATLRRRDGTSVSYLAETSTLRTKERTLHLALLTPEPAHAAG
jgi:PAS domain S-box-containing protein